LPFCAEIKRCFSLPTVYWQLFHNPLRFPATNPPECGGCEQIVNKAFLEACTVNGKFEKSVFKKIRDSGNPNRAGGNEPDLFRPGACAVSGCNCSNSQAKS
jgi:hypothetical protein